MGHDMTADIVESVAALEALELHRTELRAVARSRKTVLIFSIEYVI